ncbi:hypothetical protein C8F04DRAFT_1240844 [Mycena alexandri]|uniref:Uncharacterized protein n=1 Tax=Mycena alexandri TaxID=1745969 RepID=A0AAD6S6V4_9AGAR|nr:hypothetical protein C8F04DRAFT_1240844 [Mycena alexandri]
MCKQSFLFPHWSAILVPVEPSQRGLSFKATLIEIGANLNVFEGILCSRDSPSSSRAFRNVNRIRWDNVRLRNLDLVSGDHEENHQEPPLLGLSSMSGLFATNQPTKIVVTIHGRFCLSGFHNCRTKRLCAYNNLQTQRKVFGGRFCKVEIYIEGTDSGAPALVGRFGNGNKRQAFWTSSRVRPGGENTLCTYRQGRGLEVNFRAVDQLRHVLANNLHLCEHLLEGEHHQQLVVDVRLPESGGFGGTG